jgi:glycine/D-amino acid oxidase-like deaminating enzyme
MRVFDFVVIGGGIAGLLSAYFLKEYNTLLVDKKGILEGASKAAGAFLFPKVGINTTYTRFINDAIINSISFYNSLGINTYTKGVLILPRDERDIEKFKKYEKEIKIPYKKVDGGFFFDIGSVIDPEDVKEKIKVNFEKLEVNSLQKNEFWEINGEIKAKNIILATGYESIIDIPYINIRPIWGERIEIKSTINSKYRLYHKNCSVGIVGDIIKIGATHKRNCLECKENLDEANELINKAREIVDINEFEITDIKGGFRAASVDYFPVVGKIIDVKKTLLNDKHIVKGDMPKEIFYIDGLYIINGMGGRGFSNAYVCAKMLKDFIVDKKDLGVIDNKRLFIKWARKRGEEYLRSINVKG